MLSVAANAETHNSKCKELCVCGVLSTSQGSGAVTEWGTEISQEPEICKSRTETVIPGRGGTSALKWTQGDCGSTHGPYNAPARQKSQHRRGEGSMQSPPSQGALGI